MEPSIKYLADDIVRTSKEYPDRPLEETIDALVAMVSRDELLGYTLTELLRSEVWDIISGVAD